MTGPDHAASLEPAELTAMVTALRQIERAIGSPVKRCTPTEARNRTIARKSLVTIAPVRRGEPFTSDNLGAKRPATGLSPMAYWDWLGKPADRDYDADEEIGRG